MSASSDFSTIARAIRFLRDRRQDQPTLAEVAAAVGLSPGHFQRVFSRWAGVSPKRYLQYLTFQDARKRIQASEPLLQAAFNSGLSGPARLHDLFVNAVAATPGEYRKGGEGLDIRHGVVDTPYGLALMGITHRGLCHLSFLEEDDGDRSGALSTLQAEWPGATLLRADRDAQDLADSIFSGGAPPGGSLSLHLKGTNFQLRVWEALLRIPLGTVTTYGRLAKAMGRPGAARAVGAAVGRNPVAWLIPCHRVLREEGSLGGYRWDPIRKEAMLAWEADRRPPALIPVPERK